MRYLSCIARVAPLLLLLSACGAPVPSTPTAAAPPAAAATPPPPSAPAASSTAAPAAFFAHPSRDPAIAHGDASAWDGTYTDPGAVVVHDGRFHMFRNGFRAWPASVQIGYATSPDGITWSKQGSDPVLRTDQVAYAGVAALASSALVQDDGTWVLYFYTWNTADKLAPGAIGRATAPAPAGPWKPDPAPILVPGAPGSWDEKSVRAPHVIRTDAGYRMYYSGSNSQNAEMIGMASSPDGVTWTKYDDPATTDAAFAASDPVLRPGGAGAWDAGFVHQPRVVQTPDGWVMFYRANKGRVSGGMGLGYATSSDGIRWVRSAQSPLLTARAIDRAAFWFTNLVYHDGTYFLFWEVETRGQTNIHVAVHRGPLR